MKRALLITFSLFTLTVSAGADAYTPDDWPKLSLKGNKKDGDPINVVFVCGREDLVSAMERAGWRPADPLTVRSLAHEIESIIAARAYVSAPVSRLYLFGRRQDMSFEQLEDKSPKHRHHVRFWAGRVDDFPGPVWFGAATYDRSVGLSRYGGEITHHIDPDIDLEREKLVNDLTQAGKLRQIGYAQGLGLTFGKRNGEGDLYFTDGEIAVCYLVAPDAVNAAGPAVEERSIASRHKLQVWKFIKESVLKRIF